MHVCFFLLLVYYYNYVLVQSEAFHVGLKWIWLIYLIHSSIHHSALCWNFVFTVNIQWNFCSCWTFPPCMADPLTYRISLFYDYLFQQLKLINYRLNTGRKSINIDLYMWIVHARFKLWTRKLQKVKEILVEFIFRDICQPLSCILIVLSVRWGVSLISIMN
jgi:hypothetical protein